MIQKNSTIALIQDCKVLLLKRGSSAPYNPDRYCLPGGKVEHRESLINAAIRELSEEAGINLDKKDVNRIRVRFPDNYSKIVFFCFVDNVNVKLNYEHSEYFWASYSDSVILHKKRLLVPKLITTVNYLKNKGCL